MSMRRPRGLSFSHTTPFFHKDKQHRFENELRLLRPLHDDEQVFLENPDDYGRDVLVNMKLLIHRIITHKRMPEHAVKSVRSLTKSFCRRACVQESTLL